jgi:glutamate formiminotransferase
MPAAIREEEWMPELSARSASSLSSGATDFGERFELYAKNINQMIAKAMATPAMLKPST